MISLVSTVRAPLADLERFVAYHRNVGVGRIQLFFDDPADPAAAPFQGRDDVEVTLCTPEHWRAAGLTPAVGVEARQIHNARLALARSRTLGHRWLLHLDADELVYTPQHDLAGWLDLRAGGAEAVIFPTWEAFPARSDHAHPFEASRLFKTPPTAARLAWAARAGCRQALRYGYFCGHMAGKAAVRVAGPATDVGIHAPTGAEGRPLHQLRADDAALLHYDGCSFEAWRRKWAQREDGSGVALNMRPDRRRQFEDYRAAAAAPDAGALLREYRRQRLTPAYECAMLQALGLARRVRLPARLFRSRLSMS